MNWACYPETLPWTRTTIPTRCVAPHAIAASGAVVRCPTSVIKLLHELGVIPGDDRRADDECVINCSYMTSPSPKSKTNPESAIFRAYTLSNSSD